MCVNPKSFDELRGQKYQRIGCLFGRYGLGNGKHHSNFPIVGEQGYKLQI